jgi:cation:H+ antiporter
LILEVAGAVGGVVVLGFAADAFVVGSARLANLFRVSPVVIGAVVIGFGTSAPELWISGLSSVEGHSDLAVGNIIGSTIANLTLVLGAAAMVTAVHTASRTLRREAPLAIGAALVFAVVVQEGLTTVEGVVLLLALAGVLVVLLTDARTGSEAELVSEVRDYLDVDWGTSRQIEIGRTAAGLVGVVVGAQLLVWAGTGIADELDVTEGYIGLTIVAIGTSLPELATAVSAARKREDELLIGNLWGSNIFNCLAVAAVAAFAGPGRLDDPDLAGVPVVTMVAVSVVVWALLARGNRLVRLEALALLVGYAALLPLLSL